MACFLRLIGVLFGDIVSGTCLGRLAMCKAQCSHIPSPTRSGTSIFGCAAFDCSPSPYLSSRFEWVASGPLTNHPHDHEGLPMEAVFECQIFDSADIILIDHVVTLVIVALDYVVGDKECSCG